VEPDRQIFRRLDTIQETLSRLVAGDLDARAPITDASDEVDGIASGLNLLAEEIQQQFVSRRELADRQAVALEGLLRIMNADFRHPLPVNDVESEFDAINLAINMTAETLDSTTVSRTYVENILASMVDTLVVVNPDATIRTVNEAMADLLGYERAELEGKPATMLFATASAAAEEQEEEGSLFKGTRLDQLVKEGAVRSVSLTYRAKDGTRIPMNFNGSVMCDKEGKLLGIVGVARDMREINKFIDEMKARAEELQAAYDTLRETQYQLVQTAKLTALGEMAAGVAHELNQPLHGIKLIVQDVLRDIEKDRFDVASFPSEAKQIVNLVRKMGDIIDHMRRFTRSPEERLRTEEVDVNASVSAALTLIGEQLRVHNIELTEDLAPTLPSTTGDPNSLEQVFINLITNARDAIGQRMERENRRSGKITIRSFLLNETELCVDVEDDGGGISPAVRDRIFEPFFTTKEAGKGTGLGLSICRTIVGEYGGRIELDLEEYSGCCFHVILPVSQAQEKKM